MNLSPMFRLAHIFPPRRSRIAGPVLVAAALLLAFPGPCAVAQQSSEVPTPPEPPSIPGIIPGEGASHVRDPAMQHMMEHMATLRNTDRQKQIVADTARLLKLAKELNADVAKSNENTLSMSVVKKAGEIEKLAKTIKERMASGY